MLAGRLGKGLIIAGLVVGSLGASVAYADIDVKVELQDFKFATTSYTVRAGEKVKFALTNTGARPHDVAIGKGTAVTYEVVAAAGNIAGGASGSGEFTFTEAGDYEMWCPVGNHRAQGMVGTFKVLPAGAALPAAATLPRTGEPVLLLGGLLAAAGAALSFGGRMLRRR